VRKSKRNAFVLLDAAEHGGGKGGKKKKKGKKKEWLFDFDIY